MQKSLTRQAKLLTQSQQEALAVYLGFQFESFYPFTSEFIHTFVDVNGVEHEVSVADLKKVVDFDK